MASITIKNGSKFYGDQCIFIDQQLTIDSPGLYFITGPSGCGKSTLLYILSGIEKLTSGEVKIQGNSTMIFQNYELIKEFNVFENIFFKKKGQASKNDLELLHALKIDEYLDRKVNKLSFGQRQRIGIARALAQKPAIILCDEPTESLDIDNKLIVMDFLKAYSKDHIVIIVSHDKKLIERYDGVIYAYKEKNFLKIKDDHDRHRSKIESKCDTRPLAYLSLRLVLARSVLLGVMMMLMIIATMTTYLYKREIFVVSDTTKTLSADYIYIKANDDLKTVRMAYSSSAEIILNSEYALIDGTRTHIDILPYHENSDCVLTGSSPYKNGIIANDRADLKIDDKVVIEIVNYDKTYEYEAKIVGIIEEPDSLSPTLYYDLDSLIEDLDIDTKEAILRSPQRFEAKVGYDRIHIYDENHNVSSPLYDMRTIMLDDSGLFSIIFDIAIILFIFMIFIFIFVFERKDARRIKYDLLIMQTLTIDIRKVKSYVIIFKVSFTAFFIFLATFLGVIIKTQLFDDLSLDQVEYLYAFFLVLLLYLFYITNILIDTQEKKDLTIIKRN